VVVLVLGGDGGDDDGGGAAIGVGLDPMAPLHTHRTVLCFFEAYCCEHQTSMLNAGGQ